MDVQTYVSAGLCFADAILRDCFGGRSLGRFVTSMAFKSSVVLERPDYTRQPLKDFLWYLIQFLWLLSVNISR